MNRTMRLTITAIAATAALAAPAFVRGDAAGAAGAQREPAACGTSCRAAYRAIAAALPHDQRNVLARAVVRTPGFDYAELSRALGVPTAAEIVGRWRAASAHAAGTSR